VGGYSFRSKIFYLPKTFLKYLSVDYNTYKTSTQKRLMKKVTRDLLYSVKEEYSKPYKLKKKNAHVPIQLDLIESEPVEGKIIPFSGFCFEIMANLISSGYGHHAGGKFKEEDRSYSFMPDLISENGGITEVKSCKDSDQLKLRREQMAGYASYQLQNNGRRVDFVFFSHDIEGIRKGDLTRSKYIERFRKNILFGIKVPLAIPLQFYTEEKKILSSNGLPMKLIEYRPKEKCQARGYAHVSVQTISAVFLREFLRDPENMIKSMHLDTLDFKDPKKYIVKGATINGRNNKIKPFPFLELQLKDEGDWTKKARPSLENFLKESDELRVALSEKDQESIKEEELCGNYFNWEKGEGSEEAKEWSEYRENQECEVFEEDEAMF